jgi:hypothetical protein
MSNIYFLPSRTAKSGHECITPRQQHCKQDVDEQMQPCIRLLSCVAITTLNGTIAVAGTVIVRLHVAKPGDIDNEDDDGDGEEEAEGELETAEVSLKEGLLRSAPACIAVPGLAIPG